MFGLWASRLLAFVILCCRTRGQNQTESDVTHLASLFNKTAEEGVKNQGYLAEDSDYLDVPVFKNQEDGHLGFYNVLPWSGFGFNSTKIVINKCCPWNYYFEVESLQCVRFEDNRKNTTESDFFINKVKNHGNGSNYLFIEYTPRCENFSVLSVQIVSKVGINSSGVEINDGNNFSDYCIDENPKYLNETVVVGCVDSESYCRTHSCIRKCCSLGESYEISGRKCQRTNHPFKPEFYDLYSLSVDNSVSLLDVGVYLGDACECKGKYLLEKEFGETSYLGKNGELLVPLYDKRFPQNEYCVEYVTSQNNTQLGSFLCFSKTPNNFENSPLQFFLLSLGLIVSCMFLMLTFLVYLFSSKSQNLYGKTLMCYIICLFTAYLCLAVVELKSKELEKTVCTNMGYASLFSFLAAFFWLNVMSFDIWKTFRLDRSVERNKKEKIRLQFIKYSLYAWSFPSAITAVCAVANHMENFPFKSIRPGIGEDYCWFSKQTKAIHVFFIAPISLIITCNVFFYVQTAWKIWKVKSDVNKVEKQKTKKFSANKDQFMINAKLFIVMGITWSLEIISFFAPHPIWYITDTANALHGVFIFAIFVLKKKYKVAEEARGRSLTKPLALIKKSKRRKSQHEEKVIHQVSQRLRNPLKKMKTFSSGTSEEVSTKRNVQELNTDAGKTFATKSTPISVDETRN